MKWDFNNGEPIYQQIIRVLQTEIASGSYPPGSRFPSVRELALKAGVNPNTMQRALAQLERDGLLETMRTTGKFVTEDQEKIRSLRSALAAGSIQALVQRLRSLGLNDEQILEEVAHRLEISSPEQQTDKE